MTNDKVKLHRCDWIGTYSPGGARKTSLADLKKPEVHKQENKWWGTGTQSWHFQGRVMKYLMAKDLRRLIIHSGLFNFHLTNNCIVLVTLENPQPFENKAGIQASFSQYTVKSIKGSVEVFFTSLPAQTVEGQWMRKALNCIRFCHYSLVHPWPCNQARH